MLASEILNQIPELTRDKLTYYIKMGYIKPRSIRRGAITYNSFTDEDINIIKKAVHLIINYGVQPKKAFIEVCREYKHSYDKLMERLSFDNNEEQSNIFNINKCVFISYAKEDIETAKLVNKYLNNRKIKTWLDVEELLPGQKWKLEISKAIKKCNYFIALLSKSSVSKKGFVQKEIKEALDVLDEYPEKDIFIIPLRINNCTPTHSTISELHWIDIFPESEFNIGMKKVISSICD